MRELQIFSNSEFGQVRTLEHEGKVLFMGADVAKILGYSNTHDALIRHCKEDGVVKHEVIDDIGRVQTMNFITEGNLYRLIAKSKLPSAEIFEKWVFDEVLPSVRKYGGYMLNQENMTPEQIIANALIFANNIINDQKKSNRNNEAKS